MLTPLHEPFSDRPAVELREGNSFPLRSSFPCRDIQEDHHEDLGRVLMIGVESSGEGETYVTEGPGCPSLKAQQGAQGL